MKRRIFGGIVFASMVLALASCDNVSIDISTGENDISETSDTSNVESSEKNTKTIEAKVLAPTGEPVKDVNVNWYNKDSKTDIAKTNTNGVASIEIPKDNEINYSINLTNLPHGYSYNPYLVTQTTDSVDITLINSGNILSGDGKNTSPYEISEGYYNLNGNDVYYTFTPTEKGTYTIESYAIPEYDPIIKFTGFDKTNAALSDLLTNKLNSLSISDNDSSNGLNFKFKFDVKTTDIVRSKSYTFLIGGKESSSYSFSVTKSDLEVEDEVPELYNLSFNKVGEESTYTVNQDAYLKVIYFYDTRYVRTKTMFDKLYEMMDETCYDFDVVSVACGSRYTKTLIDTYFTENSISDKFISCYDDTEDSLYKKFGGTKNWPLIIVLGKNNEILAKYEGEIIPTAFATKVQEIILNKYNDMSKVTLVDNINNDANKAKVIGSMAISAPVKAYDGSRFVLGENRGKVVVINMWATWCGPCTSELPNFDEVNKKYSDVEVWAIHGPNGYDQDDYDAFMAKRDWSITFAKDYSTAILWKYLGSPSAIPCTIIVDKNGVISDVHVGSMSADALEQLIEAARK